MTDDENIIRRFELDIDKDWASPRHVMLRVAALARVGAAVQPRPISEAPKDGPCLYWIEWADDMLKKPEHRELGWHEHRLRCWSSVYKATHFIPLSALPVKL